MAFQSVIEHQARSHYRAIRSDYVAICKEAPDPVCAAAILDLAEFWTNHILDKTEEETPDGLEIHEDLWFFRSEDLMAEDLFNAWGLNKLRNNREWLIKQKFLALKKEVRPIGGYINYYRLEIETIQAAINQLPPVKNKGRSASNRSLKIKGASFENNAIRVVGSESLEDSGGKPQKITDADKLAQAYGLVPASKADWTLFGKLARELKAAGVIPDQFKDYMIWLRKQAKAQGDWTVTPNSLTSNARPSLFISELAAKQSPSPARQTVWGYVPDYTPESQIKANEKEGQS